MGMGSNLPCNLYIRRSSQRQLDSLFLRLTAAQVHYRGMKMRVYVFCAAVAVALLAGCATPYGDQGVTGGISETDLGNGKIQIKVVGNDWTSFEQMEAMWRQKAATIAATRGTGKYETLQFNVGREAYGLNVIGGAKVARGIIQLK
jgi:hypothetical protein